MDSLEEADKVEESPMPGDDDDEEDGNEQEAVEDQAQKAIDLQSLKEEFEEVIAENEGELAETDDGQDIMRKIGQALRTKLENFK